MPERAGGQFDLSGPALALVAAGLLARRRRLHGLRPLGRDPGFRARRHRRQYADDAGPRPAWRPGLVRPRPASPGRLQHPLVAAGRPADRRAEIAVHAHVRRADRRADRGRGRADAADAGRDGRGRGDRAADGRADRLSARHRPARLRRIDHRHVGAAPDRPSRLAARRARLVDGLADRPEAGAWRRDDGHLDRLLAGHRPGDAALSRRGRRDHRPDVGPRRRRGAAARRLRHQPRRRLRLRLPRLHLRSEHGALVRRADAGLAVGDARRRRDRGRARLAEPAKAAGPAGARRRRGAMLAGAFAWGRRNAWAGSNRPRPSSSGCGFPRCARRCRSGGTASTPRPRR